MFWQIAFLRVKVLKILTLAWNSLQKGKTVRFSWKLYKTLFSDHAQHVFPKSHFWGSKFWKSSHSPEILFKKGKQCAFHENCTKRSFQIMRSTFWPNRIFGGQTSESRYTCLKFSSKRENSALSMKIVQNVLFRTCPARFGKIAFVSVKVVKIVKLAWNCPRNGKRVHFTWKLYKTLFWDHAYHVLAKSHLWASKWWKLSHWPEILFKTGKQCAFHENFTKRSFHVMRASFGKSHFWGSKFWKSSHSPEILFKKGKQCAFHENCTKRSFQIMRSTFCPSRICERQSSQNRHTGLKFSLKRENSAFSMKIVQNALFTSCGARFGQIAFLSVKVFKIVAKTGLKLSSKRENSALSMKIVQNALFRSCAARFGQIAFVSVKVVKIVTLAWNSLQRGKTVRFSWKLYKTLFSGHAEHVLANRILERQSCQNRQTGQKLSSKRKNSALFMRIVENALFRSWAARFDQIAFLSIKVLKNRHTGVNFWPKLQNSALSRKVVQNALFRSCAARFGQIAFVSVKVVKILTLAWNSLQKGKTVRFSWNLYETLFSGH